MAVADVLETRISTRARCHEGTGITELFEA